MFIVTNITNQVQQIHLCDGSGISITPGEEVELNFNLLFPEEQLRIKKFFMIEPLEKDIVRVVREDIITENLRIIRSSVELKEGTTENLRIVRSSVNLRDN